MSEVSSRRARNIAAAALALAAALPTNEDEWDNLVRDERAEIMRLANEVFLHAAMEHSP